MPVRDGLLLHDRVVAALSGVAMSRCRSGKAAAGVAAAKEDRRGIRTVAADDSARTQLLTETLSFRFIADGRGTETLPLLTPLAP